MGLQNGGRCRQVVAIHRWSLAKVWLYNKRPLRLWLRNESNPNTGQSVNRKCSARVVKPVNPFHQHHCHEGQGRAEESDETSFDGCHKKATTCKISKNIRGQFHQTLFGKQKVASIQSLAKKCHPISATKFRPNMWAEICQICPPFVKHHSPKKFYISF